MYSCDDFPQGTIKLMCDQQQEDLLWAADCTEHDLARLFADPYHWVQCLNTNRDHPKKGRLKLTKTYVVDIQIDFSSAPSEFLVQGISGTSVISVRIAAPAIINLRAKMLDSVRCDDYQGFFAQFKGRPAQVATFKNDHRALVHTRIVDPGTSLTSKGCQIATALTSFIEDPAYLGDLFNSCCQSVTNYERGQDGKISKRPLSDPGPTQVTFSPFHKSDRSADTSSSVRLLLSGQAGSDAEACEVGNGSYDDPPQAGNPGASTVDTGVTKNYA